MLEIEKKTFQSLFRPHECGLETARPQIANGAAPAAQAHDQTLVSAARNPSAHSIDELRLNRSDLGFRKNAEPPRNLRVRVDQVSELIFKHLVSQHFPGFEIP